MKRFMSSLTNEWQRTMWEGTIMATLYCAFMVWTSTAPLHIILTFLFLTFSCKLADKASFVFVTLDIKQNTVFFLNTVNTTKKLCNNMIPQSCDSKHTNTKSPPPLGLAVGITYQDWYLVFCQFWQVTPGL